MRAHEPKAGDDNGATTNNSGTLATSLAKLGLLGDGLGAPGGSLLTTSRVTITARPGGEPAAPPERRSGATAGPDPDGAGKAPTAGAVAGTEVRDEPGEPEVRDEPGEELGGAAVAAADTGPLRLDPAALLPARVEVADGGWRRAVPDDPRQGEPRPVGAGEAAAGAGQAGADTARRLPPPRGAVPEGWRRQDHDHGGDRRHAGEPARRPGDRPGRQPRPGDARRQAAARHLAVHPRPARPPGRGAAVRGRVPLHLTGGQPAGGARLGRGPEVSLAFSEEDYRAVDDILQRYYSILLTDCGTGMLHSAMQGVLALADTLVIVSTASVDGAASASATMDWLDAHGHRDLVRRAVTVISNIPAGGAPVDVDQLARHFAARTRRVVRVPYDPHLAAGGHVDLDALGPTTRAAYLHLAAAVADGFGRRSP